MTDIRNRDPFLTMVNDGPRYMQLKHIVANHAEKWILHDLAVMVRSTLRQLLRDHDMTPACDVQETAAELRDYFRERIAEEKAHSAAVIAYAEEVTKGAAQ